MGTEQGTALHRFLAGACIAAAAASVGLGVLGHAARPNGLGDFSCYYYAARAALEGGSPYDLDLLNALAHREIGRPINPYFYPPPFLLLVAPLALLPVAAARIAWLALEAAALAAALLLARRLLEPHAGAPRGGATLLLAVILATFGPINDDLAMGQANALVLLAILLALHRLSRDADLSAGAWLGAAAMMKMSPALLLGWALVRGRWRALAGAAAAVAALSAASLAVVGPDHQASFYGEVLPGFSSRFPQVKLRIDWYANHSLPSAVNALLPSEDPMRLSRSARTAVVILEGGLLLLAALLCRRAPATPASLHLEASIFLVLMAAFPVFAFDHHLVHLVFPFAVAAMAASQGLVSPRWLLALAIAYGLVALRPGDLASVKAWSETGSAFAPLVLLARRGKLLGMAILLGALVAARVSPDPSPRPR